MAKPRPASPARAASIVALSASRLVCAAIALMVRSTSLISWLESCSRVTLPLARETPVTASSVIRETSEVFALISVIA
nr:hypothetical protein GCM10020092_083470 [Actinoplanes digitatis]